MMRTEARDQLGLLSRARSGDQNAFEHLVEPYRRELHVHCYRMLGSFHDAEDMVQEAMLRTWRGLRGFRERSSFRTWLYRIATNACLDALGGRSRRILPDMEGPPAAHLPNGKPATELAWLEPYPDRYADEVADLAPGPDARYELRESVQLAFLAAIQHLPPRQRVVLLLRDVLGWSANESADLLGTSVASANSALQRARATLDRLSPAHRANRLSTFRDRRAALVGRYIEAWEQSDLDGLIALLKEDAFLSMPPWSHWYHGRDAIGRFFAWAWETGGYGSFKLVSTAANRQTALAVYSRSREGVGAWHAHSIQLLDIEENAIAGVTAFIGNHLFTAFGLPATLPTAAASG